MTPISTIGIDIPIEWLAAHGFSARPIALHEGPTTRADAATGMKGLSPRGRRLLEPLLAAKSDDAPVLVTTADAEQIQVYAILRELARLGEATPPPCHLLDLIHLDRPSARTYNRARLDALGSWLDSLPRTIKTATSLEPDQRQTRAEHRVVVTGTRIESDSLRAALDAAGFAIVGDEPNAVDDASSDDLDTLASPRLRTPPQLRDPDARAAHVADLLAESGAETVLHVTLDGDEAAPWMLAALKRRGLSVLTVAGSIDAPEAIVAQLVAPVSTPTAPATVARAPVTTARQAAAARSRKSLASLADFGRYQRDWFAGIRARAAAGEPFAVVNANAPQEILRALDVPFVVNQWWASIVAAKQQSRRYLGLLKAHDLPTRAEPYSAQGLAALFDDDADLAPWGGLPHPDHLHAVASSDATAALFAEWGRAADITPFIYARTVDPRWALPIRWWDDLPERWEAVLEPARLDLLEAELAEVIAALETATGRRFDTARFAEVMDLVNEQEGYYRQTRDLIAQTVPAPIGIVDSMPATMVPQWHRGTVWARDAAKAFHDEVAGRVAAGEAAVPNERIRLMWVGRGLWSDMAWYQRWEESHGAVFVWSMYLALAADGYLRSTEGGQDPMRALAARFVTMGDELRLPGWAGPWHVHEAETHGVDAAVALSDADPFVLRALQAAGVPVLDLGIDNYSPDAADDGTIDVAMRAFLDGPAAERAARRSGERPA